MTLATVGFGGPWRENDALLTTTSPARSFPARTGRPSGPPPPTRAKCNESTACHAMAAWIKVKGAGTASTTWPGGRCGATTANHRGSVTGLVVSGTLVARFDRMGARATAATTRAITAAIRVATAAWAEAAGSDLVAPRRLTTEATRAWV